MALRSVVIPLAVAAIVLMIACVAVGKQLSMLLDRVWTVRLQSLPVEPLGMDASGLRIGETMVFTVFDQSDDLQMAVESGGRVMLSHRKNLFPLGSRAANAAMPAAFVPDPRDTISYTIERSALSWPTPFATNFITGWTTSWRRHRYYRLRWMKRSGASLEVVWRYEQWFYPQQGWTEGNMTNASGTGLVGLKIRPGVTPEK